MGKAILFARRARSSGVDGTIEVLTLADGRRKVVARGGQSPHYLPSSNGTGHLLYVNKATLFAIPFDLATLETRGTAAADAGRCRLGLETDAGLFAVSRTGTLIYRKARADAAAMTTVQWTRCRSRQEGAATGHARRLSNARLSPDGKRIALVILEGVNQDIWVYEPQRDASARLTFGGINLSQSGARTANTSCSRSSVKASSRRARTAPVNRKH